MKVTIGKEGLEKTWQEEFPDYIECVHCTEESRIGFVAHEGMDGETNSRRSVSSLHHNDPNGNGFWLHDDCAVAVYFCKKCLKPTALYNQA